ncbi:ABC transporter substrate-binding protein [Streptomyces sp. MST-110588]|uniref:ABC transporter substrate-binding protein n=1 Tax=Streptomyces sp. MST-110588 TaxID=2833628 RepID=UPI001F5C2A5D|nr:ABC transporter substrate-binding protein [Streptomyces sp. MST-110588]UNO43289.1 carbohydrate ABC transporter substrate-binding protein [Streptomyces sp. MST-110588]
MRRTPAAVAGALLAALLTLLVSGCGQAPVRVTPDDFTLHGRPKGHLTILEKWADPEYAPYFKDVVRAYEQRNPGVTIDLQAVGDQPYKDRIAVLAASRDLPDIYFAWPGRYARKFADGRLAADLSGPMREGGWGSRLDAQALDAFTFGGRRYGVPLNRDAKVFAYHTGIFAEAGITAPPRTFPELLDACDRIKKAGHTPLAFGNQYGWPAGHLLTQFNAMEVPASVLARDYDGEGGDAAFTHPGYERALKDLRQLKERCMAPGGTSTSHESAQARMLFGKAAMQYLETLEFSYLSERGGAPAQFAAHWDFFPMPGIPSGAGSPGAVAGGTDGLMVSNSSPNKALAVDFLKFLTSREQARKVVRDLGWLSAVKGTADAARLKGLAKADRTLAGRDLALWLDTRADDKIVNPYLAAAEAVLGGDATPGQAMDQVRQGAHNARRFAVRR